MSETMGAAEWIGKRKPSQCVAIDRNGNFERYLYAHEADAYAAYCVREFAEEAAKFAGNSKASVIIDGRLTEMLVADGIRALAGKE